MNLTIATEIESSIFSYDEKTSRAASAASCILGVMIDLKRACCVILKGYDSKSFDDFTQLLLEAQLSGLSFKVERDGEIFIDCYISKSYNTAMELKTYFDCMKEANKASKVSPIAYDRWANFTRMTGNLLGYPDSAIRAFIKRNKEYIETGTLNNEDMVLGSTKYRHFAHTKKFLADEIEAYDKPLNDAIREFLPKTASFYGLS